MTQEEKELLLRDLCARLPYGFTVHRYSDNCDIAFGKNELDEFSHFLEYSEGEDFKPYLRPMSSMTEEEKTELDKAYDTLFENLESGMLGLNADAEATAFDVDFYNSHYLDYRGLIPDLALEAPEGMYEFSLL